MDKYTLITKEEAARRTQLSAATLKKYRLSGDLIEGVHWVRINARSIRYRSPLVEQWAELRHDPEAHLGAIEEFERSLKTVPGRSNRG